MGGEDFDNYVRRFYSLFSTPDGTELHVVPGNHDMGFHYRWVGTLTSLVDEISTIYFNPPVLVTGIGIYCITRI